MDLDDSRIVYAYLHAQFIRHAGIFAQCNRVAAFWNGASAVAACSTALAQRAAKPARVF